MSSETKQTEVGFLTSKVVQLQVVPMVEEHENYTDRFVVLYAVCEDGSVWERVQLLVNNRQFNPDGQWRMVHPPNDAVCRGVWKNGNSTAKADCPFEVGDVIVWAEDETFSAKWTVMRFEGNQAHLFWKDKGMHGLIYREDWGNYKVVRKGG